ncbi:hypothetical protein DL769_003803 [Monosporascus sp. CRB-8-3]|nr:hypothetical protein DL769_003803 [Monosporascus sp. CRB-8-3]
MYQLVYGDLVDDLFDYATKTDKLEDHSPAVRTAVDYAIIHIATLLHCIFSLSAEGPYLLKLLENANSLIPYSLLGQTLRIGNAASMMNGLFRLILAKVSVGAVTNWLGLTQNAADGMNLLQRIISLTLEWDASDFRKAVEKIKKDKDRASDECFAAIDGHIQSDRAQHDSIREASKTQRLSIVIAILESADKQLPDKLTDSQHSQLLEYYSAQLAIRDRAMIVDALCRQSPDFTTSVLKEVLAVFDPMIRAIHQGVDLRKHLGSLQKLLADLIKTSKPKQSNTDNKQQDTGSLPPSVDDYVDLLRRNRYMLFEYLHDVAKNCPGLRETWRAWAKHAVKAFRHDAKSTDAIRSKEASDAPEPKTQDLSAGSMDIDLQRLFDRIPVEARNSALAEIDAHAKYLRRLEEISSERMQRILDASAESRPGIDRMSGPGVYLAQWQSLLDNTTITPESKQGPLRRGKEVKGLKASVRPPSKPLRPPLEEEGVSFKAVRLTKSVSFPSAGGACFPTSFMTALIGPMGEVTSGPTGAAKTVAADKGRREIMVNCIVARSASILDCDSQPCRATANLGVERNGTRLESICQYHANPKLSILMLCGVSQLQELRRLQAPYQTNHNMSTSKNGAQATSPAKRATLRSSSGHVKGTGDDSNGVSVCLPSTILR